MAVAFVTAVCLIYGVLSDDTLQCSRAEARVSLYDGAATSYEATWVDRTCPSDSYNCGAIRKVGRSYLYADDTLSDTSHTWSTLSAGCRHERLCKKVLGGDDTGCQYASYAWNFWEPHSCNESASPIYDATIYRQFVKLYYGCCDSGDYCINTETASLDWLNSHCTENEALGDYLSSLHTCWNRVRYPWRKYFVCDTNGTDIFTFREYCSSDTDDRYSSDRNCTYVPTCSRHLQYILKTFGECACTAADDNGFTGGLIGSFMETLWNRFCPHIDLSCGIDGLWLRRSFHRFRVRWRWAKTLSSLSDDDRLRVRVALAWLFRMRTEDIGMEFEDTDGDDSRRRLGSGDLSDVVFTIDTDDEDFATNLADWGICDEDLLGGVLNATISIEECQDYDTYENIAGNGTTTSTPSDTTKSKGSSDVALEMNCFFAVVIGLVSLFLR